MATTSSTLVNGSVEPPTPVVPAQAGSIFNAGRVVHKLETLMERVTEHEATEKTVMAACQCAAQIGNLLRLHLEAEKLRREDDKIRRAEDRLRGAR